jgi:predicted HicB family RNase H-like nuclease
MMRYKGYVGVMEVDSDAGLIHGRIVGVRDVITFEGESVSEATQAFKESVDDYLEWCSKEGRAPEKPFNGKLLIRLDPAIHRRLAILAETQSKSINALATEAFTKLVGEPGVDTIQQVKRKSGKRTGSGRFVIKDSKQKPK